MKTLSSTIVLRRLVWYKFFVDLVVLVPSKLLKLTMNMKISISKLLFQLNMHKGPCYFIL